MGATAGVLLPSHSDKAKAAEPNFTQLPLPSETTGNPYQAVAQPEATVKSEVTIPDRSLMAPAWENEALSSARTIVPTTEVKEVPIPAIAQKQKDVTETWSDRSVQEVPSFSSSDSLNANPASPSLIEAKHGELSQSSTLVNDANAPLDKKHSKIVSARFNEQTENPENLDPSFSASESDAPHNTLNFPPASSEASTIAQTQPANPIAPTAVAKTPEFVDTNAYNEPVVIPVPPPETATVPVRKETALTNTEPSIAIPVPQPETVADRAAEEAIEAEVQPSAPNATQPELIAPEVAAANREQTYRVQSGDTIDEIALRYGVSRSDLVRANALENPHQIQIAQELKIPQPQSIRPNGERYETVIPGFNVVPNEEASDRATQTAEEGTSVAIADNRDSVIVPTESPVAASARSSNSAPSPASESVAVAADRATETSVAVTPKEEPEENNRPEENTVVNASANPYIERLKADILRMREEYRSARENNSESETPNETVVVADASSSQSVNPEWQSESERRSNAVETTANSLQVYTVQVTDNRSEASKNPQAVATNEQGQPVSTQIAVAPVPPVEYNNNTRPQTGVQVSPELPPLSPDRYLPEQPAQFNGYMWPTTGVLTSGYGRRWGRMHRGIDIAGPTGTPVVAAAGGEVISAGWNSGGYGNLVDIRHPDGSMTRYAHNSKILVRKGQWVEQGERISLMGSTGYSTGPHLHFEVHPSGQGAVNPIAYLPPR